MSNLRTRIAGPITAFMAVLAVLAFLASAPAHAASSASSARSQPLATASLSGVDKTAQAVQKFRVHISDCPAMKLARTERRDLTLQEAKSCAPNATVSTASTVKGPGIYIVPAGRGYGFATVVAHRVTASGGRVAPNRFAPAASAWEDWSVQASGYIPVVSYTLSVSNIWLRWGDYVGDPNAYVDVADSRVDFWRCNWGAGTCSNMVHDSGIYEPYPWAAGWHGNGNFNPAPIGTIAIACTAYVNVYEHAIGGC